MTGEEGIGICVTTAESGHREMHAMNWGSLAGEGKGGRDQADCKKARSGPMESRSGPSLRPLEGGRYGGDTILYDTGETGGSNFSLI